jgi:hypothetical protein
MYSPCIEHREERNPIVSSIEEAILDRSSYLISKPVAEMAGQVRLFYIWIMDGCSIPSTRVEILCYTKSRSLRLYIYELHAFMFDL